MTTIEHPRVDPLDDLPIEEDDVTATELHERLKELVRVGLAWRLGDQALVIGDIFVASGRRQVSPDVLVRFGAHPGERNRYLVDVEGVPDVTIEILSAVNHTTTGLIKQQEKRDLFGAIGVSEHIEIDPLTSTIQVWSSREGLSQSVYVGKEWRSTALHVTFRFDVDGFAATDDDGQVFVEATASLSQFRAERDEAAAERDNAKSERDRAAAERDQAAAERDRAAADRDRAAAERDQAAAERDNVKSQRDEAKSDRDQAAAERDNAAAERDQAAADRDRLRILLERHGIEPG